MNIDQLERKADKTQDNLNYNNALLLALGNPQDWDYTGVVVDSGKNSTSKCACGHHIRYQFIVEHNVTGEKKSVGSTCVVTIKHLNPKMVDSIESAMDEIKKKISQRKSATKKAQQLETIAKLGAEQDVMRENLLKKLKAKYNSHSCGPEDIFFIQDINYILRNRVKASWKDMDYVSNAAYIKRIKSNIQFLKNENADFDSRHWVGGR